jgi:Double zinc ribbon
MPLLAIFGIDNDGINLAINLLILFLVVVYLALVAYTYLDAKRRLEDPVLIGCATVASLFPFLGTVVYTILRPPEFLEDKRERELEIRASQLRVRQLEESSCPNCEYPVDRAYLRCPNCRARIKDPCEACGKPIDPRWSICPYCETPTRQAAASPQRRAAAAAPSAAAPAKPRSTTRPARAKRPVSRTSTAQQRTTQQRTTKQRTTKQRAKAPVRRSTSKKPSPPRSEPGEGPAPASS